MIHRSIVHLSSRIDCGGSCGYAVSDPLLGTQDLRVMDARRLGCWVLWPDGHRPPPNDRPVSGHPSRERKPSGNEPDRYYGVGRAERVQRDRDCGHDRQHLTVRAYVPSRAGPVGNRARTTPVDRAVGCHRDGFRCF